MELPPLLRAGVDEILRDTPIADIRKAAELLSQRYRGEVRDGRLHLSERAAATAYLATRLPATYTAVRASLAAVADVRPEWAPDRKSTRLNSSHLGISYAVFCLK